MNLTRVKARPLNTEEDYEKMIKVYQEIKPDTMPVATTHVIEIDGKISGGFCLHSPTVYWWMVPERNSIRHSMSAFGCMETLMAQEGVKRYILAIEDSSPYLKMVDSRVEKIIGEENNDNWKLFLKEV